MKKWEYKLEQLNVQTELLGNKLDDWGNEGWELVSTITRNNIVIFVFKREKIKC